jgi:hypothetical protein
MTKSYQLLEAAGPPRRLGREHGEQCQEYLRAFVDYLAASLQLSRTALQERALRFRPLFEQHVPDYFEEVVGLAEGAGVTLAEALIVQVRGALAHVGDGACTTFVATGRATAEGQVLIGQNSDVEPEFQDFAYVLRLRPDNKPAVLMWTFGGQLGYHGLNDAGVAHFANDLGGGPPWRFALPHYPIKRRMLECCRLHEIFNLLAQLPACSNGNYGLCDGAGQIADVELTSAGFTILNDEGRGFIAHSNHFLCGQHATPANHDASLRDSFPRLERMHALLAGRQGQLTAADCMVFLADHAGEPTSICRHPHDGPDHPSASRRARTAAALVAEPAAGRLHVARGNPCANEFRTYTL